MELHNVKSKSSLRTQSLISMRQYQDKKPQGLKLSGHVKNGLLSCHKIVEYYDAYTGCGFGDVHNFNCQGHK